MTLPAAVSGPLGAAGGVTFAPKVASRVRSATASSMLLVAVGVLAVMAPDMGVAWFLLVSQLPMAVIRWLAVRAARRQPWALRVYAVGVWSSPHGTPLVWGSIACIEVYRARGLRRLLPHWDRVLLVNHVQADFARRAKTRPVGRAILLDQVRATPEEVIAALRRRTDAPVGGCRGRSEDDQRSSGLVA